MSTGQISLGIIIFYLVAMLVITICNGRKKKQKSAEGFFLANRGVSSVLLPLTMIASCISVLMTMVFLSMQYVGNARAMSIVSGNAISYTAAIIVSILFSLMYVLIGGAGGVVLLDAIQAIILT